MCRKVPCITCNKQTWFGCGSHVAMVMDAIPVEERCTCEPRFHQEGKTYPPMAKQ